LPSGWDDAFLLWGRGMSASKFFDNSTLGSVGGSFEKLNPWTEPAPDPDLELEKSSVNFLMATSRYRGQRDMPAVAESQAH